jgi:hypothetical protein
MRATPLATLPKRVARRVGDNLTAYRLAVVPQRPDDATLRRALPGGADLAAVVGRLGRGEAPVPLFAAGQAEAVGAALERLVPGWAARTTRDADRIRGGTVRLLGADEVATGARPPWHEDVLTGYRWNPRTHHRRYELPVGRADVKVPWELSRCQHLTTLGMAYGVTGDSSYAGAVVAQVDDWIDANPPGLGINWGTAMEVAIRACNWLFAYELIRAAPVVTDDFRTRLLASLIAHARHVEANIEGHAGGITTNHTLANHTGLVYLGAALADLPEAQGWLATGLAGAERCMEQQVGADGVHYENSTSYHRLVLEMLLAVDVLAGRAGRPTSGAYRESLERMLEYTLAYTRPDGLAPLVGDNDDGRLHVLGRYFDWSPQDHRHLLGVGAALFGRDDFAAVAAASPDAIEETAWLLGADAAAALGAAGPPPALRSRAFAASGVYVMRSPDAHALVSADEVGTGGIGSHKHNDVLGYELSVDGVPVVVDPGTAAYTGDVAARERSRSTRSHSTVMVDGVEQNEPVEMFGLRPDARVEVAGWTTGPAADVLDAAHTGYERLPEPVAHRRRLVLGKEPFGWLVLDTLDGDGEHLAESFVQLAPEGTARPLAAGGAELGAAVAALLRAHGREDLTARPEAAVEYERPGVSVAVVPIDVERVEIEPGWHSPRYGRSVPAPRLRIARRMEAGTTAGYAIVRSCAGAERS